MRVNKGWTMAVGRGEGAGGHKGKSLTSPLQGSNSADRGGAWAGPPSHTQCLAEPVWPPSVSLELRVCRHFSVNKRCWPAVRIQRAGLTPRVSAPSVQTRADSRSEPHPRVSQEVLTPEKQSECCSRGKFLEWREHWFQSHGQTQDSSSSRES